MIGRIKGIIIEKSPPLVCIDVHGVGYDIDVPMSTLYDLPEVGTEVSLYTHLTVREDAHILFGFLKDSERQTFRTLIKISGIGTRTALAILSGLDSQQLAHAVSEQETSLLTKIPGIGKKTAERLLLELKGKLDAVPTHIVSQSATTHHDITHALMALGYSEREAIACTKTLADDISVEEGIKMALKNLAR